MLPPYRRTHATHSTDFGAASVMLMLPRDARRASRLSALRDSAAIAADIITRPPLLPFSCPPLLMPDDVSPSSSLRTSPHGATHVYTAAEDTFHHYATLPPFAV
jgi:hypothetical protein